MRGLLDSTELEQEYALVRNVLNDSDLPHLHEFSQAWPETEKL